MCKKEKKEEFEEDKIVLICAVGRSGSTTLQLLFNTIPNSNICGENNASLLNLLEFYRNLKFTHRFVQKEFKEVEDKTNISTIFEKGIKPAWYNSFDIEEMVEQIKNVIRTMFKKDESTTLWGYKEIRYAGKLDLLYEFRELFPQTKIVLNIRENILEQSKSSWFTEMPNSLERIQKESMEMIEFYKKNRGFCFLNTMERILHNKGHRQKMFAFIDCLEDYDEEKIQFLLENTRES
jgi:hypothetical protein